MSVLKYKLLVLATLGISLVSVGGFSDSVSAQPLYATTTNCAQARCTSPSTDRKFDSAHICGAGDGVNSGVGTAIAIGCQNKGNPITDMLFAVIRFLSNGVGIVIIGSIIYGGIQYSTSGGDPQKAAAAMGRIRATLIALGIYIFSYPLLNYVLPSGFFN
jgi:hypothetical protein